MSSTLEVFYVNALYKFTFDIWRLTISTSKTANDHERWHYPPSHCLSAEYCRLHLHLLFYYSLRLLSHFATYHFSCFILHCWAASSMDCCLTGSLIFANKLIDWLIAHCSSYRSRTFWRSECICNRFGHLSLRVLKVSIISTSCLKSVDAVVLSYIDFLGMH